MSTNGFVSFGRPGSRQAALFTSSTLPLIAPLLADFDFRQLGSVHYRVIEQDCQLLPVIADKISNVNPSLGSDFQPTMCVIVTWFEAHLFGAERDQFVSKLLAYCSAM